MNAPVPNPDCPAAACITENVPMLHVADVDRSAAFYALLGFACDSRFSGADGTTNWVALSSGKARLFLARASGPVNSSEQAVLFYMYSEDIRGMRTHLLQRGLVDAGPIPSEGQTFLESQQKNSIVFEIIPRFYMPLGELRIHDPDGYCILVGQIG